VFCWFLGFALVSLILLKQFMNIFILNIMHENEVRKACRTETNHESNIMACVSYVFLCYRKSVIGRLGGKLSTLD